ncbi:DUF748 domain-containing protein [Colwellia sp. MB02u-9]|uniref:DUF748 domain-containing protein n=1 Tax=Colwellia sp. MB02u-9 TaxID=2759823 RepID=UPI0015F3B031|nr:DUF748 domain-containing protein [Colwellia sp. MB02u-9]MBA6296375.1 DUF748 domain-containing protein [Colwellia sp. MB02u-9]
MGRYFKRLSQILVITFILLYALIWLLSPIIIRYALNTYGLPKPLLLTSASSIRYNPFTAHLTISHLEVKTNQQSSALKLQSLNAELHLHQLLFDKIYVAEFTVNGLFIPVMVNESSLNVAGIELRSENSTPLATEAETEQASTDFPYQVIIPEFTLTDADIELVHFSQTHNIQLDSFSLQNILLAQNEQEIKLNLVSHLNGSLIEVALDGRLLKQQGKISIDLNAKNIALSSAKTFLPSSISAFDGKVSYASKMDIVISNEQTSVNTSHLIASVDDLHVEQNNIALAIKRQKIQVQDLAVLLQPNKPINVDVMLNYVIEGLAAKSKESNALLAEIENLSANNIALQYQQNMAKVTIENVQVANSEFSKNRQQNMPALAAFNSLSVNNIEYTPELIAVNNITLSGLVANVLLDKEKQLATLVALANNEDKKTLGTEQESKTADNELVTPELLVDETNKPVKPIFKLGQFSLLDGAQIDFKDTSVTPYYERNVNITHLLLSDLDSGKPEQEVVLNIQGKSDKYANFDLKGRGLPFAPQQKFTLDAVIKEVSLPGISSYIKEALQYEIESGQLDITLKAALTGKQLDGDIDLLLRGIEFTSADDHERGVIKEQFSVPFNVALGMLKDSDGNVALSLPLTGDTSSPSFGLSGLLTLLVKQATMSAAKDYLITTFVPYASVMKVAMAAGEFALKLRINDLTYPASATELNTEQLEFSRQMSVMLADRDKVNVKLCAVATASDIALTDASQAHQPENIARLNRLSQQRVEIFKAHMVEQLKVPSARLLFCTPQIDTSNGAKPRIKFVI